VPFLYTEPRPMRIYYHIINKYLYACYNDVELVEQAFQ
jgi:hypothetical protein